MDETADKIGRSPEIPIQFPAPRGCLFLQHRGQIAGLQVLQVDCSRRERFERCGHLRELYGDRCRGGRAGLEHGPDAPRRLPQTKQKESELVVLRKMLLQAVNKEAYEEAAKVRDRIRQLEES